MPPATTPRRATAASRTLAEQLQPLVRIHCAIRSRGYSTDAEESTPGGFCYGVGIFSAPSKVEAAISLSMPKSRLPGEEAQRQRIVQFLAQTAGEIAQNLAKPRASSTRMA